MIGQFAIMMFQLASIDGLERFHRKGMEFHPTGTHLHGVSRITEQAVGEQVTQLTDHRPDLRLLSGGHFFSQHGLIGQHLGQHAHFKFTAQHRRGLDHIADPAG